MLSAEFQNVSDNAEKIHCLEGAGNAGKTFGKTLGLQPTEYKPALVFLFLTADHQAVSPNLYTTYTTYMLYINYIYM